MDYKSYEGCSLCEEFVRKQGIIVEETAHCFYVEIYHPIIEGWGMILPKAHRKTSFDLTKEEFLDTHSLLSKAKLRIDKLYQPDGYNIGWNVDEVGGHDTMHAHLHIFLFILDFHDNHVSAGDSA